MSAFVQNEAASFVFTESIDGGSTTPSSIVSSEMMCNEPFWARFSMATWLSSKGTSAATTCVDATTSELQINPEMKKSRVSFKGSSQRSGSDAQTFLKYKSQRASAFSLGHFIREPRSPTMVRRGYAEEEAHALGENHLDEFGNTRS